ncbi:membrane protein [soil metagenome]
MKQAVICIVPTEVQAENIVDTLKVAGFLNTDISVLMPDRTGIRDLGTEKHSKAPEGTSAGAASGAVLGGALGWLAGIGALAIPGVGPFVAAGPIMAALSGAAIGAATGGVTGGLIGLGMPEYEAKQYEGKLRDGNILLSVHTDDNDQAKRAEEIFKNGGAKDITRSGEEAVKK